MITQSILVQIAVWWSASTMVGCVVVVPRQRVTAPDDGVSSNSNSSSNSSSSNTDVPPATTVAAVTEDSVHLLTAVGFPPPALLIADPGKKWTLDDFQKPAAAYSVTDEPDHADDDWATAAVPPPPEPEPEPEATTAATADYGHGLTGDGETATTAIDDERGHDHDDGVGATTAIAAAAATVSAVTPALVATVDAAAATEANGPPPAGHQWPPRPVHVHQHDGPAGWPVRQTVATYYLHRGRYPVAVVGRPHQTIALSFRPVRAPLSGFRFPDVRAAPAANAHRRSL